ncbi:hypothetical protein A2U01_0061983, partial [Trifolium medium]|nr:hypothetical protein [Trifolium medium]
NIPSTIDIAEENYPPKDNAAGLEGFEQVEEHTNVENIQREIRQQSPPPNVQNQTDDDRIMNEDQNEPGHQVGEPWAKEVVET